VWIQNFQKAIAKASKENIEKVLQKNWDKGWTS
jgi:hypothetical protein